jgi:outer membrane protein TolC
MKNLFKITLVLGLFTGFNSFAQESILGEINSNDLAKYIELAKKNYPRKKIFEAKTQEMKSQVPVAQLSYLDMFNANYFYRPEGKQVIDPVNPYNVAGFQFGVSLSLGSLLQKPFQVKRAKSQYKIAKLEAEEYDSQLVLEVKNRYYDYIQQVSQLKINTLSAQDNKGVAESLRNKFEKGEITLDAYNQSRIAQSESSSAKIQAEIAYLKAKDLLEEIIGVKLTEVK